MESCDGESLTVKEIQHILRQNGLPVHYKKKIDLINRLNSFLKANLCPKANERKSNSEVDLSTLFDTMEDNKDFSCKSHFSFSDVESAINCFSGESYIKLKTWLKSFEEISSVCKWNEMQKYLFCRRLLKGAARAAIEAADNCDSYQKIKDVLSETFDEETLSIDVHKKLAMTKKQGNETFLEYFFKIKQIARSGNVDERSWMEYIITGIRDTPQNKAILYSAQTADELKQRLRAYEVMKKEGRSSINMNNNQQYSQANFYNNNQQYGHANFNNKNQQHGHANFNKNNQQYGQANSFNNSENKEHFKNKTNDQQTQRKRCVNCGSLSHATDICPHKDKGMRCFNCGDFGHMSKACPQSEKVQVNTISNLDMHVIVMIANVVVNGLLDTGSEVSLMQHSIYKQIEPKPLMNGRPILMSGIGQAPVKSIGSFSATISVNQVNISACFHVISDKNVAENVIIGRDLMNKFNLIIRNGQVEVESQGQTEILSSDESNDVFSINVESLISNDTDTDTNNKICQIKDNDTNNNFSHIENENIKNDLIETISSYVPVKASKSCVEMEILLENEKPIFQPPRRLAEKERKFVREQVNEWIEEGIAKESQSSFSSPVVIVKKSDGTNRLCIDYRKINKVIIKERYPLPIIEDVIEKLYDATYFTTLDLKNGFFHVDVKPCSRKYTSFITPDGQFEFCKVPFGLCNSPSVFQRFINTVFCKLIRSSTIHVYMDDIIIPSKSEDENFLKLRSVIDLARQNGLFFRWEKCTFMKKTISFLGYIISNGSVKPSKEKTLAIKHFPIPKNLRDVQSFLGLAGYFRKFIKNFSLLAKPLSDLTKKDTPFIFGFDQQCAFSSLKEMLISEPILKLFNPSLQTELHTDASSYGYGACLLQCHDDNELHPVYFISYKTSDAEKNYASYELEVLSIIRAIKKLRVYLVGLKFIIYTDCKAFEQTMNKKDLCARIARWALFLQDYDCEIRHRNGSRMRHVDALSRYPYCYTVDLGIINQIKNAQRDDRECQLILKVLQSSNEYKNFVLRSGLIYTLRDGKYLLYLPKSMQHEIIKSIHEQGHFNAVKVEHLLRQEYDFPKLTEKVKFIASNCVKCILAARKHGKQECFLNPINKIDIPLHTYHVDHVGPLQSTNKGYKHLFVIVDGFTKFVWLYPVKTLATSEILEKLKFQQNTFGNPYRIISDRHASFTSNDFESYCKEQNIIHLIITTGVPRGNGQVERVNAIVTSALAKLSVEDPSKWFKFVPDIQKFINSNINRSTNTTPFELLFGTKIRNKTDKDLAQLLEEEVINEFVTERIELRSSAKSQIIKIQQENKNNFNRKRKIARKYKVNDLVAIKRTQFGPALKVHPHFLGPYKVTATKPYDRYELEKVGIHDGPIKTSSVADQMKPWNTIRDDNSDSSGTDE